jgi:pSer/pThr/pTyr-binding forkhead associated (FHA) protein/DNA-directed RNA polymerase subunit RPC12/RpoP
MSGTMAGTGSFRCEECGYVLTLSADDTLTDCPGCGGRAFARASLFSSPRFSREDRARQMTPEELNAWLANARGQLVEPGEYLAYADGDDTICVALVAEWTRVGRSLAADVRFDDPTVSRRHALIVRQPDGVRVLDDRSLNGVFVNGKRVEWSVLKDGDEIVVGRYRLHFLEHAGQPARTSEAVETAG